MLSSGSCVESFVLTVVLQTSSKHFSSGLLNKFGRTYCYGDCFPFICGISLAFYFYVAWPKNNLLCVQRYTCSVCVGKSWILLCLSFSGGRRRSISAFVVFWEFRIFEIPASIRAMSNVFTSCWAVEWGEGLTGHIISNPYLWKNAKIV